jgi:KDO2-lipid IV(A) lauroyltransferase
MSKRKNKTTQTDSDDRYEFRWAYLGPKYWLIWIGFGILWTITRLPLPAVLKVGDGFGLLLYKLGGSRVKTGQRNLELCFPEKSVTEREQILLQCFKHCGHGLFLSGIVWWSRIKRIKRLCRVEGLEPIVDAVANGEKVLLVVPHSTCLEISSVAITDHFKFNVLFRVHDNPMWEYVAGKGRGRFNVRLFPRKEVKGFLQSLETEGTAALAPDQDLGAKRSVFVPFFGIQTATVPSVSDFATLTGAKVAFVDYYMDENNTFVAKCGGILDNFPTDDKVADTARLSAILEESIRQHPEQYLWLHRRFKTRPEGEAKLY